MKSAAALKLKLAQWATENSPPSHPIALLLFIIQEVERDSTDQGSLSPSFLHNSRGGPSHTKTDLA